MTAFQKSHSSLLCLEITSSQTAFFRPSILLLLLGTGDVTGVIYNYYIVTVNVLIIYKYTNNR